MKTQLTAILVAILTYVSALSLSGQVKINEVSVGMLDYVELWNCSPGSIDISGWKLTHSSAASLGIPVLGSEFLVPPGTFIPGNSYLVVEEYGIYGQPGSMAGSIATGFNFYWNTASSLTVGLIDDAGRGIDYVFRDTIGTGEACHKPPGTSWLGSLSTHGGVIARIQTHDTDQATDWRSGLASSLETPLAPNPGQYGDASPFSKVMITEVNSGNPDGLELTNFASAPISLLGWRVEWGDTTVKTSRPLKGIINPGESVVVLEEGGIVALPAGTQVHRNLPSIGITGSAFSVRLVDPLGVQIDEVRVSSTNGFPPAIVFDGPWRGTVDRSGVSSTSSVARIWGLDSDSATDWTVGEARSFGKENTCAGRRGSEIGHTYLGENGYIEYVVGDGPIVISAPHGGTLEPSSIPDRNCTGYSGCSTARDTNTLELARELVLKVQQRTGHRPHLIINHLHRIKLDPNRGIAQGAMGDPQAEQAWREFHAFIEGAEAMVTAQYGRGLYLDIHGHGHPEGWVELGYALTAAELALPDWVLNAPQYIDKSTIRSLGSTPGIFFPEVLRGATSLGGYLQSGGYNSVPSTVNPDPNGGNYWNGGYNVRRHGSRDGGVVDGVQLELPWSVRSPAASRAFFIEALAVALEDFFLAHYSIDLTVGPTYSLEVPAVQVLINEIDDDPDYIELFNPTASAVNLENWFFLCSAGQNTAPIRITPFSSQTYLEPGEYIVIGDFVAAPAELPAGVSYIPVSGSANVGQNIPFITHEMSCALYDRFGRLVDLVRATRENSTLAHNHPRAPSYFSDWFGAALRNSTSPAAVTRVGSINHRNGGDWGSASLRTMGSPNESGLVPTGFGHPLDVRVNGTALGGGLCVIVNAGPAKAGYSCHVLVSLMHSYGFGPNWGLGSDATAALALGPVSAQGALRIDFDPGTMGSVGWDTLWLLTPLPAGGPLDSCTLALQLDT